MAYVINRFNGQQLVSVEDGTVDQTTDIKLVGKNYSGYGEAQNENFIHMLEHFAGTSAPTKALSGQVWFDSATNKLKFYTGDTWKNAGGAEVNSTEPAGLNEGDLWYSTTSNQLFAKTNTGEFILVGPQAAGDGSTQMLSTSVLDAGSVERNIIVALINDNPQFIISTVEFTLNTTQPAGTVNLTGFSLIKKGITLLNTSTSGITTDAGDTGEPVIWGTASDALRLGGVLASDYLTSSSGAFTDVVTFVDAGFRVGNSNDLHVKIVDGNVGQITNEVGDEIKLGTKLASAGSADVLLRLRNTTTDKGLFPASDNVYALGSSSLKFSNVVATTFTGTATQATALYTGSTYVQGRTTATANTVAVRDSSGNITANEFNGTATKARYADLAEKYTTDKEYPVGTAMAVSNASASAETASAKSSDICIGVISEKPAYLMNAEIDGQAIALKGRVPVRVKEPVSKGQAIYAWEDGVCTTTATRALVGIALETNENAEEKLVECVLKV